MITFRYSGIIQKSDPDEYRNLHEYVQVADFQVIVTSTDKIPDSVKGKVYQIGILLWRSFTNCTSYIKCTFHYLYSEACGVKGLMTVVVVLPFTEFILTNKHNLAIALCRTVRAEVANLTWIPIIIYSSPWCFSQIWKKIVVFMDGSCCSDSKNDLHTAQAWGDLNENE